ncbi:MAG: LysM peptidoglycan-binding domain-containing protein, partial [Planctomycetes bacterium]|nr:LysM peptidoglycan-binding domain-containing protein [Planctomycetota bacterium]
MIPVRRQEDITTIRTIYTIKFSELREVLRKISLKSLKKKWAFGAIPLLFIITAWLGPVFVTLSGSARGEERLQVVSSGESLGLAQGGPTIHSASIVFATGIRNANTDYVYAPEAFYGYGEGPTEPSLASVAGGALLKQSSPLTPVTANNIRTNIIEYTVQPGDIPSIIAASFGITTNTLLWANNLSDGQLIRPGDELVILPVSGVRYKVQQGDTISSIASIYKGEIDKIIAFNGLGVQGG